MVMLSGFSWELAYLYYHAARGLCVLLSSTLRTDLPILIDVYTL